MYSSTQQSALSPCTVSHNSLHYRHVQFHTTVCTTVMYSSTQQSALPPWTVPHNSLHYRHVQFHTTVCTTCYLMANDNSAECLSERNLIIHGALLHVFMLQYLEKRKMLHLPLFYIDRILIKISQSYITCYIIFSFFRWVLSELHFSTAITNKTLILKQKLQIWHAYRLTERKRLGWAHQINSCWRK
jgi:hypothetical protein